MTFPVAVKPIEVWLVLIEFVELVEVEFEELLPTSRIVLNVVACLGTGEVRIVGVRPVDERVVESELQSVLTHLLHERRNEVALGSRSLHGVQVAVLGVPQSHTIVVLGGEHGVACAALLDEVKPCLRVVVLGCEAVTLSHVLLVGQILVVERPTLRHTIHSIDAVMDENTQLSVVEPLHSLVRLLLCLLHGGVLGYSTRHGSRTEQ